MGQKDGLSLVYGSERQGIKYGTDGGDSCQPKDDNYAFAFDQYAPVIDQADLILLWIVSGWLDNFCFVLIHDFLVFDPGQPSLILNPPYSNLLS